MECTQNKQRFPTFRLQVSRGVCVILNLVVTMGKLSVMVMLVLVTVMVSVVNTKAVADPHYGWGRRLAFAGVSSD